jgi:ariadne-1
VVTL